MLDNLDSVYQEFKDLVKTVADGKRLDEIRVKFLGKNGLITNEAKKIANHAIILAEQSGSAEGYTEVRHMGASVTRMLANALDAFARFNVDAAMRTLEEDKQIDLEYKTALRELVTYMMEDPRSISRVINVLWVIRSLERIGDHAKNLCEQIVFVVKGKDIRHQ